MPPRQVTEEEFDQALAAYIPRDAEPLAPTKKPAPESPGARKLREEREARERLLAQRQAERAANTTRLGGIEVEVVDTPRTLAMVISDVNLVLGAAQFGDGRLDRLPDLMAEAYAMIPSGDPLEGELMSVAQNFGIQDEYVAAAQARHDEAAAAYLQERNAELLALAQSSFERVSDPDVRKQLEEAADDPAFLQAVADGLPPDQFAKYLVANREAAAELVRTDRKRQEMEALDRELLRLGPNDEQGQREYAAELARSSNVLPDEERVGRAIERDLDPTKLTPEQQRQAERDRQFELELDKLSETPPHLAPEKMDARDEAARDLERQRRGENVTPKVPE